MTDSLATRLTRQLGARLIHRLRRFSTGEAATSTHAVMPAPGNPGARFSQVDAGAARPVTTLRPAVLRPAVARPLSANSAITRRNARAANGGARCTVDPSDGRRTLICGRMSDVCDALDLLIARQALQGRAPNAGLPAA